MNYLETIISRAIDDLRYRLHRLTLDNLNPENNSTIIIPQSHVLHGLLNQYEDPFILTANVTAVAEEWYRRGVITGLNLNNDCNLNQVFEDRNQHLIESFKQWFIDEIDNLKL